MAVEKNLIQVQSELQSPTVRDADLIKYANGENPSVPSFLALMEMSRRKQLEEGSKAYDASNQKTIKDQLANALTAPTQMRGALTGAPANQVNPGAAPTGISMGNAPASINVGAAPANQVNPAMAPAAPKTGPFPAITGAAGGLMSLPVAHFNANSYAGGGIVAFGAGDLVSEEKKLSSFPEARPSATSNMSEAEIVAAMRAATSPTETAIAAAAPAAKGYQGILDLLPKVQAPTEKSLEQLYADRKAVEKMAGVSDDPYSEAKKRMAAMEERQAKENEGAGLDRLLAQMSAFAKADPSKGFGYAAAVSSDASRGLEKEQRALVEKQETAQIEFSKAVAKEEDARRHKDADGVLAAQQAQQEAALKFQKAEHDRGMLAAHIYQTDEYAATRRQNAALAAENKPDPKDVMFNRIMAKAEADPTMRMLAKKQEMLYIGSDEYNAIEREKYRRLQGYFANNPELMPPQPADAMSNEPIKQPSWSLPSWLGGSSKAPKTVSFGDLPN